ncbi:MAG TPA: circadian clock protein KaiC [Burkholderiaceae bacterium]|jgi:circadian clock protein KaiC
MDQSKAEVAATKFLRLPTGIDGFDDITGGGLPLNRISILIGDTGTGKTVFTLQVLANNARRWNASGIFVAFEENTRDVLANSASFGWDLEALEKENKLYFLDAHLTADVAQSGSFDLIAMLSIIIAKAKEIDAKFIAFDSLEALLTLLNDPIIVRRECYRLRDWLRQSDLTCIITVRKRNVRMLDTHDAYDAYEHFTDVMRYMADCVIALQHDVIDHISLRELRILKYRGSLFCENAFPMIIDTGGIDVSSNGQKEPIVTLPVERISSGIDSLDVLLDGGYFRGTSVLITGAPGIGKTALAGRFASASCMRGECTLYVTFDQSADALIRNFTSLGVQLRSHTESGALFIYAASATMQRAEEHMVRIKALIRRHKPRCLIIDPLSAPLRLVGLVTGLSVADQLLHHAKSLGITSVLTSVSNVNEPFKAESITHISPIADTWIHLSYWMNMDEYKRALLVVKSHGTKHAHKMHELILNEAGVKLKDFDFAGNPGLMEKSHREREGAAMRLHEAGLHVRRDDGQVAALRRELKDMHIEISLLLARQNSLEGQWKSITPASAPSSGADKKH